ncbi:helix-turn-helix domain-containing protein [Rhodococcus zopfii]|uniref:Helix-turn-helix domain-containing protein n=1 Tax=Rhodococcus zopfii TaxID=43772 RepID=A0ABU3WNY7_9NOCA|nr:helix-turn-helix domain-containing protein [Rhodococcus zopfii]MDV2477205.1 helix-turn-helix domain-containing protein [Rhodococcus zopfii]
MDRPHPESHGRRVRGVNFPRRAEWTIRSDTRSDVRHASLTRVCRMARWTDDEDRRLEELYADGWSLNAIAKEMCRSKDTIGRHAESLGLSFGTERTAEATAVKVLGVRERKAAAAEAELRILELSQKQVLDVLNGNGEWSTLRRGEGGSEYVDHLGFIPARDLREHTNARSGSAAIIDKLSDATVDAAGAKSTLAQMHDVLTDLVDNVTAEDIASLEPPEK